MNRFDNGSVSAYTPQSMQELAFTPLMKRAKHDEMSKNLAELDAIATDPLDVHQPEALRIKQEFEGKIGNLSGDLATRGIDSIGVGDFYKLKKERDDLIAPTGRIGEINNSKIVESKVKDDFFKNADKRIPQSVLENNWQEYRKKYTGYSDLEKTKIENIKSLGSVGYQDLESDIKDKAPLLGETTKTKLRDLGARYEMRPQGMILVTGNGKEITTENSQQLNELGKVLESKYFNNKGEGYAYNKFAGKDQQNQLDILNNSLKMMIDDKTVKDMNTNYQHIDYPESSKTDSQNNNSLFGGEDYNTKEIGKEAGDFYEIEKIGKGESNLAIGSSPSVAGSGIGGYSYDKDYKGKVFSSEDIKDPLQKAIYDKSFKEMSSKGMLANDGKRYKIPESMLKLGKNDPKIANMILEQIKKSPMPTYTDKILTTNNQYGANGFPQYMNKDKKAQSEQVLTELRQLGNESRKIIDTNGKQYNLPEFLKEKGISYDEFQKNMEFQGIKSFDRIVDKTDVKGNNGSGPSPLMVSFVNKDGAPETIHVTRINSDNRGMNTQRLNEWQRDNKLNLIINPNEFVEIKSNSKMLNGVKVRNNIGNSLKYNENGEPLSYTILDSKGNPHDLTSEKMLSSYIKTN